MHFCGGLTVEDHVARRAGAKGRRGRERVNGLENRGLSCPIGRQKDRDGLRIGLEGVLAKEAKIAKGEFVETHDGPLLLDSNRHEEIAKARVVHTMNHGGSHGVGHLQHHFVADDRLDTVD